MYMSLAIQCTTGFHLEIIPRGGETIVFLSQGGRESGKILTAILQQLQSRGAKINQGGRAPPLNETLHKIIIPEMHKCQPKHF